MRQRGAAYAIPSYPASVNYPGKDANVPFLIYRTRKIKEVDFGFSFGLAPPVSDETAQPASEPSEPANAQAQSSTPHRGLLGPRRQGPTYRSPGASRNDLPERPSLFDIPQDDSPDDAPVSERSRKRRKVGACMLIATEHIYLFSY